MQKKEKRN